MRDKEDRNPLAELAAPPIFVVGVPRSGTTWVADILGAHPNVARVPGETHLFDRYLSGFARIVERRWDRTDVLLSRAVDPELLTRELRLFASRILAAALGPGDRYLVEKTPNHLIVMPFIAAVFPEARFVHVIRDGRDVFVSARARSRSRGDPAAWQGSAVRNARRWSDYLRQADRDADALAGRIMEIRYEQLKADPLLTYKRLFDFCGIAVDDQTLADIREATDFGRTHVADETGFYRGGRVGDWRTHVNFVDGLIFNLVAGDTLKEKGYEGSRLWFAPLRSKVRAPRRSLARAERLEDRGIKLYVNGLDQAEAATCFERALRLFERSNDSDRVAQLQLRLASVRSTFPEVLDIRRARQHLDAAGRGIVENDGLKRAHLSLVEAMLARWERRTGAGIQASMRAARIGRELGHDGIVVHAEILLGWHLCLGGRFAEGMELLEKSWRRANELPNPLVQFLAGWFRAGVTLAGRWDTADCLAWCRLVLRLPSVARAPSYRRAILELSTQSLIARGDIPAAHKERTHGLASARPSLSEALFEIYGGDMGAAERILDQLDRDADERGDVETLDEASRLRGSILLMRRDPESARRLRRPWLTKAVAEGSVWPELTCRWEAAAAEIDAGHIDDAEKSVARCEEIIAGGEEWGAKQGKVACIRARLEGVRGDLASADAHFQHAVTTFEGYGAVWERARALGEWAQILSFAGQRKRADEISNRALDIYRRLGAVALLAEQAAARQWTTDTHTGP